MHNGPGYWLKFDSASTIQISGLAIQRDSFHVTRGWNIIGSVSDPISTAGITSIPPGLVTSPVYTYHEGYETPDTLRAGSAGWIKMSDDGILVVSALPVADPGARIRMLLTSELPPPPPGTTGSGPALPASYNLGQNFPNPFNPFTVIGYQLPAAGRVTLRVYDLLGREVATLVDREMEAGRYEAGWDATGCASGVYFYTLNATSRKGSSAGEVHITRKLLLMR
jgi:hypothetical protein